MLYAWVVMVWLAQLALFCVAIGSVYAPFEKIAVAAFALLYFAIIGRLVAIQRTQVEHQLIQGKWFLHLAELSKSDETVVFKQNLESELELLQKSKAAYMLAVLSYGISCLVVLVVTYLWL